MAVHYPFLPYDHASCWFHLAVLGGVSEGTAGVWSAKGDIHTHTHTHTHTRLNQWREADKGNSLLWQQGSGCNQSELLGVLKELLHNPVIGFNDQDRQQIKMAQDRTSLVQLRKHHSKVGLHFTLHPNDLLWSSGDLFSLHFSHYKQLTTAIMFVLYIL